MNGTPPTGTEKPGPPIMGRSSISTSEKIIPLPIKNMNPDAPAAMPPEYRPCFVHYAHLEKTLSNCLLLIVILAAVVFWLILEVDKLARRVAVLAVLAVALNCGAGAPEPCQPAGFGPAETVPNRRTYSGPENFMPKSLEFAVPNRAPNGGEEPQKWIGQPFTGYHETFRWSRREWASLRETITNKQGQVLNVREEVLYVARRIGPYATNANVRNQIVRHQRSGEKARPWRLNPDGSPKWLDYQKFLSYEGKRIVMPSDGRITFDNWKEVKPGTECAEIVIGDGVWLMGYSDDGETIRTQAIVSAGQFAHACRPVGSSRVYFLMPE